MSIHEDKFGNDAQTDPCLLMTIVDYKYDNSSGSWTISPSSVPARTNEDLNLDKNDEDKYDKFVFMVVRHFEQMGYRSKPENSKFETLLDIRSPQLKTACKDVIDDQRISWTLTPLRVRNTFFFS